MPTAVPSSGARRLSLTRSFACTSPSASKTSSTARDADRKGRRQGETRVEAFRDGVIVVGDYSSAVHGECCAATCDSEIDCVCTKRQQKGFDKGRLMDDVLQALPRPFVTVAVDPRAPQWAGTVRTCLAGSCQAPPPPQAPPGVAARGPAALNPRAACSARTSCPQISNLKPPSFFLHRSLGSQSTTSPLALLVGSYFLLSTPLGFASLHFPSPSFVSLSPPSGRSEIARHPPPPGLSRGTTHGRWRAPNPWPRRLFPLSLSPLSLA